ncbi:MAG: PAS domain S-box protein, partial [Anaerolineales bacterium]|nr:PAS domain S-box protein [Anaerolineales bacterium]
MRARLRAEKTPWLLLLVFVLLSAGIAAVGISYYAAQKATILEEQRGQLAAIADLKIGQIEAWRTERLGDARIMRDNVLVNSQVEEFLDSGAAASHRSDILAWMESRVGVHDYTEAVLVALDGSVRLASPPTAAWIGPTGQTMVDEVLQTGEAAFSDLHRAGPEATLHLDLVIPLQVEDRGGPRTIGVLILRIDPSIYLFPLVQSWPTSSPSAETLLVRREGDQVLFLNELRHASDPALTLSFPITRSDLPAALAVQGVQGVVEGLDYRGVPVMAVLRPVPNTSWYMVAKIDREEIYAPIAGRGWVVGGVVAILILAAAASIGSLWRHQRAEFVRGQVEAELERKVLTEHFGYLSKYANDAIVLADHEGRIVEANERAQASYGYTREELLELNLAELRPLETRGALASQLQQVAELGGEVSETLHVRKDGIPFPVEVSARIIAVEGQRYYQGIIRDITERKRAEEALTTSEVRYRRLFEAARDGILILDADTGMVVDVNPFLVEMLGYSREQFLEKKIWELGVFKDIAANKANFLELQQKEYITFENLPLETAKGRLINVEFVSHVYRVDRNKVIQCIIRDITERKRADEALRYHQELMREMGRVAKIGGWEFDPASGKSTWTDEVARIHELNPEDEPNTALGLSFYQGESRTRLEQANREAVELAKPYDLELELTLPSGARKWVQSIGKPMVVDGRVVSVRGSFQDITERKKSEEALRESEERLSKLLQASPIAISVARLMDGA